jgi:hypothetical protein
MAIYRRPKLLCKNYILVGDPFYPTGANPKKLTKEEIDANTATLVDIIDGLHNQLVEKYAKRHK